MVIACSYKLSLIDNKEKVREKRKGILQNVKNIWMTRQRFIKVKYFKGFTTAMYLFTTIVRMQRNQPEIQNHNFIEFLVWEIFKQKRFRQKELFIQGFYKTISLPSTLKIYLGQWIMFSYVTFKATNIYHSRMFCQTPSAHKFDASRWFQKRMDQSEIENKSGIFSTSSSNVFISQNYRRVQIRCDLVEISL